MADSEEHVTDSFIFIQMQANQVSSRAGSVRSSVDGWSEISCPGSAKSTKSTNSAVRKPLSESPFSVLTGTYLQNITGQTPCLGSSSDKGYYLVNATSTANGCDSHTSQENGPVFSSNSTTDDVMGKWPAHERSLPPTTMAMANSNRLPLGAAPNNSNSIGSVGSRVPFSWAEITKIQPKFHHECDDTQSYKPKVFDSTTCMTNKIATRHAAPPPRKSPSPSPPSNSASASRNEREGEIAMPSIPEADPYATSKMRRSGKRGSRLKYPNGRRGGNRNKNARRKKSQK